VPGTNTLSQFTCVTILRVVIFSLSLLTPVVAGQGEVTEFKDTYPGALNLLEARYARVKGSVRLIQTQGRDKTRRVIEEGTFAADHGFQKLSLTHRTTPGLSSAKQESIFCVGNGRAFRLARDTGAAGYEVQGVGSDGLSASVYVQRFGRFLSTPFSIYGSRLSRIVAGSNFRVVSAEKIEKEGRHLRLVKYELGSPETPDRATLLLDPAAGWILRGGELQFGRSPGHETIRFEIEYAEGPGNTFFPRRVQMNEPNGGLSTCEFFDVSWESTPVEEFSMGFYGLPDLSASQVVPPKGGYLYWLFGLGAIAIVLSLIMGKLSKRLTQSGTTS
jgi:hypothetical protein